MKPALAYIAALVAALTLLAPGPATAQSEYKRHLGALLPRWSSSVGEHRYQSPWDWDSTIKWLDKTYGWRYRRIPVINQPGIKALHLKNYRGGDWEGINVYEMKDGTVRFFVVPKREKVPAS